MGKLFAVILKIIALVSGYPIVTCGFEDISAHGHCVRQIWHLGEKLQRDSAS
jgi:hypothetical protein